jgi:hypothetical protein
LDDTFVGWDERGVVVGLGDPSFTALGDALGLALGLAEADDLLGDTDGGPVFLHLFLHVAGQKNLTFFFVPVCFFLHLLAGFTATYASHVRFRFPPNLNVSELSHLPRSVGESVGVLVGLGVRHFLLHVAGQKKLTFFFVPVCFFLHLLAGFIATYASHVRFGFPPNLNVSELSHLSRRMSALSSVN